MGDTMTPGYQGGVVSKIILKESELGLTRIESVAPLPGHPGHIVTAAAAVDAELQSLLRYHGEMIGGWG